MTDPHPTKPLLEQGFDACVAKLTEFGYKGVTVEIVRLCHTRWKRGEKDGDIIEKFTFDDFDKYPTIFGTRDTNATD